MFSFSMVLNYCDEWVLRWDVLVFSNSYSFKTSFPLEVTTEQILSQAYGSAYPWKISLWHLWVLLWWMCQLSVDQQAMCCFRAQIIGYIWPHWWYDKEESSMDLKECLEKPFLRRHFILFYSFCDIFQSESKISLSLQGLLLESLFLTLWFSGSWS